MRSNLTKLYSNLLPDERFKAFLAAHYRDDEQDAELLTRSCPRKIYTNLDSAYIDRIDASRNVAIFFALEWQRLERELYTIENNLIILSVAIDCTSNGYMKCAQNMALPLPVTVEKARELLNENVPDILKHMLKKLKSYLKATIMALESFCHNIDVPLEHLLVWLPPALEWIESRKNDLLDVEPDKELLRTQINIYHVFWTERLGCNLR